MRTRDKQRELVREVQDEFKWAEQRLAGAVARAEECTCGAEQLGKKLWVVPVTRDAAIYRLLRALLIRNGLELRG